jgi:hypothetical protein
MEKAVRHEDGTLINVGEWRAIKANARAIASHDLLPLPLPCDTPFSTKKKTKTFFTKYYLKHWTDAVLKLEEQEPLLALCAAHWKAEHILNIILTGSSESNPQASTRREDVSDLDDPAVPHPPHLRRPMPPAPSAAFRIHLRPSRRRKRGLGKRRALRIVKKVRPLLLLDGPYSLYDLL